MSTIPLVEVTASRSDGYGSYWDQLACGHEVNTTHERPAKRRRCAQCAITEAAHFDSSGQDLRSPDNLTPEEPD
jgi:hypothetical protein